LLLGGLSIGQAMEFGASRIHAIGQMLGPELALAVMCRHWEVAWVGE